MTEIPYDKLKVGMRVRIEKGPNWFAEPAKWCLYPGAYTIRTCKDLLFSVEKKPNILFSGNKNRYRFYPAESRCGTCSHNNEAYCGFKIGPEPCPNYEPKESLCETCVYVYQQSNCNHTADGGLCDGYELFEDKEWADVPVLDMKDGEVGVITKWGTIDAYNGHRVQRSGEGLLDLTDEKPWRYLFGRDKGSYIEGRHRVRIMRGARKNYCPECGNVVNWDDGAICKVCWKKNKGSYVREKVNIVNPFIPGERIDRIVRNVIAIKEPKMKKLRVAWRLWNWSAWVVGSCVMTKALQPWAIVLYQMVKPLAVKLALDFWAWSGLGPWWAGLGWGSPNPANASVIIALIFLVCFIIAGILAVVSGSWQPHKWAWKKLTE